MDANDRQAIDGLFQRLDKVERESEPRDSEAEALIRERLAEQPASPYYMLQTIVVQEQALEAAQARIEALEREAARRPAGGQGLFASLFGQGAQSTREGASEGPWSQAASCWVTRSPACSPAMPRRRTQGQRRARRRTRSSRIAASTVALRTAAISTAAGSTAWISSPS
jgi:hypothetical protein